MLDFRLFRPKVVHMRNQVTLAPREERVANAVAAILAAAEMVGAQALQVLRAAGERVPGQRQ